MAECVPGSRCVGSISAITTTPDISADNGTKDWQRRASFLTSKAIERLCMVSMVAARAERWYPLGQSFGPASCGNGTNSTGNKGGGALDREQGECIDQIPVSFDLFLLHALDKSASVY